ncbi:hypothetical protein [Marinomonas algarum]|uniref:Lipoprotein n=1 Tax=Marinomonas algarum TaxID=2883105 RepID=A0A9X1IKM7_9GAMM|nr:hypothetical protein [Marinomonas algarum]MCB5161259.1 hypothetical protein [Marinomonas algarum]
MIKSMIFLMVLTIGLAGCSTKAPLKTQIKENPQELEHHLYAKLEADNDSYAFTEFSEVYNATEPWVRLTDLAPMWDTKKEECVTGIVEYTNKQITCDSDNTKLFREKGTDFTLGKSTSYAALSVLSLGVWATMPPAAVEFDRDKYIQAVGEANRKLYEAHKSRGMDHEKLLTKYDNAVRNFEKSYKSISSNYEAKTPIPIVSMSDESGLFKGTNDTFNKLISVKRNDILTLDSFAKVSGNSLNGLLSLAEQRNQKAINELLETTRTFLVNCKSDSLYRINYTLDCPQSILSSKDKFAVSAIVHSIDYKKVMPNDFDLGEEEVILSMRSKKINAINNTDNYIGLNSLSFYYNGKIVNKHEMNLELPPGSKNYVIDIDSMPIDWDNISFSNVDKDLANSKKIEYGFAAKYKVVDTNIEKTLLKKRTYRLFDLISEE